MPMQTATNPQTGERVVLVGQEWVPFTQTATGPNGEKAYLTKRGDKAEWLTEPPPPMTYPQKVGAALDTFAREVVNPAVGPYATAAAAGGALGAPFAGIGAAPGAALGVAALGAGDIGASLYNVGRGALGLMPVRTPSQIIREAYPENIMGEPTSRAAEAARTVAEFAVPAQAQARAARVATEALPVPGATRNVAEELARAPGAQTTQAAAGGLGLEAAREIGAESPYIEMGATLAGSMVPPALGQSMRVAGRGLYNIVEPVTETGANRVRARAYMDAFGNSSAKAQEAIDLLESGLTPEQVALQTNNSAFAALIGTARFANPQIRDLYAARDEAIQQSMATQLTAAKTAEAELATRLEAREMELGAAVPTPSQRRTGLTIARERRDIIAQRQRDVVEPAYRAAFDMASEPFSLAPVLDRARSIEGAALTQLQPSLAPKTTEILQQYRMLAPPRDPMSGLANMPPQAPIAPKVTLKGADAIIKAVNLDIAKLTRSTAPGADQTLGNLNSLRNSLEEAIRQGVSPEAYAAYKNALNVYQEQIAHPFKEGWIAKLKLRGKTQQPAMAPDTVVDEALKNGDAAIRFVSAFRDSKLAMDALENGILGKYRAAVVKGGRVNPQAHQNFMAKYRAQLGILDDAGMNVRVKLAEFGKRATGLEGRKAELADLRTFVEDAQRGLGDATPDVAAARLQRVTAEVPAVRKVVDDILASLANQRRFNNLVKEGREAGGGIKGVMAATDPDVPDLLYRPVTFGNFILSRLKGEIDAKMAAQIAVDLMYSNTAVNALAAAMQSERGRFGQYLFKPTPFAPALGVPALLPGVSNELAERAGPVRRDNFFLQNQNALAE